MSEVLQGKLPVPGVDVPERLCSKCGEGQHVVRNAYTKKGWSWRCKPCVDRRWHERKAAGELLKSKKYMPEQNKNRMLKSVYGIDLEQWNSLFESQGRVCACCHRGNVEQWATDHYHATGAVRGILCGQCNAGLGHFRDSPFRLQQAIRYLNGGNADIVSAVLAS